MVLIVGWFNSGVQICLSGHGNSSLLLKGWSSFPGSLYEGFLLPNLLKSFDIPVTPPFGKWILSAIGKINVKLFIVKAGAMHLVSS